MYTVSFQFHSESDLPFSEVEEFLTFEEAYRFYKHLSKLDKEVEWATLAVNRKSIGERKLLCFFHDMEDWELPFN